MNEITVQIKQSGGMPIIADSDHIRRQNRTLLLSALRRHAPIARVDLGAITQLSPATITAITADLIAEGLVETVADEMADGPIGAPVRRGRPRVLLRLDPNAALVLGIKIAINSVTLVLSDYAGRLITRRDLETRTLEETAESFPERLTGHIRRFLATEAVEAVRIAEIAVAAQGFVDVNAGSIIWSPAFRQRNIRIVEPLQNAFGIACTISNDANMIAEALHAQNPETYGDTFAVLFVDYGVGMGLYIGNRLHSGADGSAAEFGHVNHIPGGPLCRCGRRGCVEAFSADYAIYREAKGMSPDTDPNDANPSQADLMALEAAARSGDQRVRNVYRQAGEALGYGIARLMALINPRRVVLTGDSMRAFPLMEAALHQGIADGLVEDLRRSIRIDVLPWEKDMIITGVIANALARLDTDIFSNAAYVRRYRIPAGGSSPAHSF